MKVKLWPWGSQKDRWKIYPAFCFEYIYHPSFPSFQLFCFGLARGKPWFLHNIVWYGNGVITWRVDVVKCITQSDTPDMQEEIVEYSLVYLHPSWIVVSFQASCRKKPCQRSCCRAHLSHWWPTPWRSVREWWHSSWWQRRHFFQRPCWLCVFSSWGRP